VCAEVQADPVYEAAEWTAQRLGKLEDFLMARQEMLALSGSAPQIDRRSGLSSDEFLEQYYAANRPVVLTDVCDRWPAMSRWSPSYLADTLGDELVEVMSGREADPRYEINTDEHRQHMPFGRYVDRVMTMGWGNDVYLVANNHLLESEVTAPLWADFEYDERYLDPAASNRASASYFWFGPPGTVTPLHHDTMNLLFNQIYGHKRFVLFSPLDSHCLYNDIGVFSEVDPKAPDLERQPRFARARRYELTIGPGESLYIPIGWWHHVEAFSVSISLSFCNFRFPNTFTWRPLRIARS
jgi:ribosomal protein L16 Arg81 hydroxylase